VQFSLSAEGFGQELSPGLESIREALVNMLMHTDYFSPACPRVRIFTNHIEFYNPGGLPKPFEELKSKDISLPRNPILAKLFRMVKLAENAGFGFDKIEEKWKAYNSTVPDYLIAFDSVVVDFKMEDEESVGEVSEKTSEKILSLMKDNENITIAELTEAIGVSSRSIERNIDRLKQEGKINRIGADKGGYWQIIE
jgi:predicted HTH transcriptional regulator